jgi:hypothetical protein
MVGGFGQISGYVPVVEIGYVKVTVLAITSPTLENTPSMKNVIMWVCVEPGKAN